MAHQARLQPDALPLLERMTPWLDARPWREIALEKRFAETRRCKGDVTTSHQTRVFDSRHLAWIRSSLIWNAQGTAIVNLAGFPRPESPLPVLQAELVVVRGRLRLALVDLLPLDESPWASPHLASPVQACHEWDRLLANLNTEAEPPEWTQGVVSPHALWSRSASDEALVDAIGSLERFQEWWSQAEEQTSLQTVTPQRRQLRGAALQHLREQCIQANPSKAFLGTMFGHDWADEFLRTVLYPPRLAEA